MNQQQLHGKMIINMSSSSSTTGLDGINTKQEEEEEDGLLPGFRFHPTDEELVGFYLRRKVEKKSFSIELIKHIDIYKYDPWDLPISTVGEKEMYFFCIRERKYRNSVRPNRVTGSGFWKATGIDKPIYSLGDHKDCIGLKKSLVYYIGSAGKGTKTDWMMHEFRLPVGAKNINNNTHQEAEVSWTLCRIFKRNVVSYKKYPTHNSREATSSMNQNSSSSIQTHSKLQKSFTLEFENREKYKHLTQVSSMFHQQKMRTDHVSTLSPEQLSCVTQQAIVTPSVQVSNDFQSLNGNEFFIKNASWDELGSVVEFMSDQTRHYGYR